MYNVCTYQEILCSMDKTLHVADVYNVYTMRYYEILYSMGSWYIYHKIPCSMGTEGYMTSGVLWFWQAVVCMQRWGH